LPKTFNGVVIFTPTIRNYSQTKIEYSRAKPMALKPYFFNKLLKNGVHNYVSVK